MSARQPTKRHASPRPSSRASASSDERSSPSPTTSAMAPGIRRRILAKAHRNVPTSLIWTSLAPNPTVDPSLHRHDGPERCDAVEPHYLATKGGHASRAQRARKGAQIDHAPLTCAFTPNDEEGLEARGIEPLGEQSGMDCRAADVESCDDA